MKITVCVKIVDGELNPFDECALEAALETEGAEITVISMGPASAKAKLETLTRYNVKRVILISDPIFAGSDTLATAYILSKAIEKIDFDMIFCGRQTTDGDTAQVGPCLAAKLGIKPITNVMKAEFSADGAVCKTRLGEENGAYPCLLTFERINTLRFFSIRSRQKEIEVWDNSYIGADAARCGLSGSPTKVLKVFESRRGIRKCRFISREELIPLIARLGEEESRETAIMPSEKKLRCVLITDERVRKQAEAIAENVIEISGHDPYKAAEQIKSSTASAVLWNADLEGRRNAPIAAGLLDLGLCADCTALETDGERLFMYRPARSGNITAKIKSDTFPQMATVRTVERSDRIIVACGKGVKADMARVKEFATTLGAELCASRGAVDAGQMPYSAQVGLTGRSVSPNVYIAVGISGAVHHTVGIENVKTVIAINPDRDARIFEYADYGIVEEF